MKLATVTDPTGDLAAFNPLKVIAVESFVTDDDGNTVPRYTQISLEEEQVIDAKETVAEVIVEINNALRY